MKTLLLTLLLILTAAPHLRAQGAQGVLIKNKAKDIRDRNDAAQGVEAPAAPGAAATPGAPRGLDPGQQQKIDKLAEDLGKIATGATVAAEVRKTIQTDLTNLAKGEVKPAPGNLLKLADDLTAALAAKPGAAKVPPGLANALNILLNSSRLTPGQTRMFLTNAQNALLDLGVPADRLQPVAMDLKSITTELQPKPKPAP